jgi:catechol 2,3-dioxygenase-like lactoylglutathione lyase family enzyme
MRAPVISDIGHVSVRVRDLDAAEQLATSVMGLRVTERTDDSVWLSHGTDHHSLHYTRDTTDAVDHVGLMAPDAESIAEIATRVTAAGLEIIADGPVGPGVEDGFTFQDAEGFAFQIYSRMKQVELPNHAPIALRPRRLGHVNFFARDARRMQKMLIEILDCRVSDWAGAEGAFLRCNVDHHGIGVFPGPGHLHHHAWEYPTIVELAELADHVDTQGGTTLWGPMRHGIGRNIATYVREPSGLIAEFYCDMDRIYDDANHVPGHWDIDSGHKWMSLWAKHYPAEGFMEMGLPPAVRSHEESNRAPAAGLA